MKKDEIRKIFYQKRLLVGEFERKKLTENILLELKKHTLNNKYISIYLPIKKNNEIDTYPIIELIEKMGGKIVVPKSNFENCTMIQCLYNKGEDLKLNRFGIPELSNAQSIKNEEVDLVIIPLLAFDQGGQRVGYGKGFYDRFLKDCRVDSVKIGLSDFPPVEDIDDIQASDIALDLCITPTKIYRFKR